MPTFSVATNDDLWASVFDVYMRMTDGIASRKIPNNEITVDFAIRGVAEPGKSVDGYPGKIRSVFVVDLVAGHPIHTAAHEWVTANGGFTNVIGRAAVKVIRVKLNNIPEPAEPAEGEPAEGEELPA